VRQDQILKSLFIPHTIKSSQPLRNFKKRIPKTDLNKKCRRASPTEKSKYAMATAMMKTSGHEKPKYIVDRLKETLLTTRRKPLTGKFFKNDHRKIRKQSLEQRLDFMDRLDNTWLDFSWTC